MWKLEGTVQEVILSVHYVSLKNQTQVVSLAASTFAY